jgi:uncharacterized membrane protein
MIRKMLVAALSGALAYFVLAALPLLNAVERQDWASLSTLGIGLVVGVFVAAARAAIAYLTAIVPSDAANGVNLFGKYK